jgi:hypothetical protein
MIAGRDTDFLRPWQLVGMEHRRAALAFDYCERLSGFGRLCPGVPFPTLTTDGVMKSGMFFAEDG